MSTVVLVVQHSAMDILKQCPEASDVT